MLSALAGLTASLNTYNPFVQQMCTEPLECWPNKTNTALMNDFKTSKSKEEWQMVNGARFSSANIDHDLRPVTSSAYLRFLIFKIL